MRKHGFFVAVLPLLFLAGCEVASYSILLTNATDTRTVYYTYNGTRNSLAPQETRRYEVGAWTQPPVDVVDQHGIASVRVVTNGMTGDHTFAYARPIILEVLNTLPADITIQADNFIYNALDYPQYRATMFLAVSRPDPEIAIHIPVASVIYTDSPQFTAPTNLSEDTLYKYSLYANTGFPVVFDYTVVLAYDNDGEPLYDDLDPPRRKRKMYLTIR